MGQTIARGMSDRPHQFYWASQGRSEATAANAAEFNMIDLDTSANILSDMCDIVFCIVRGGSVLDYAREAVKNNFSGIYVDGNGMWGEESEQELATILNDGGIEYVSAGLYGWPHPTHRKSVHQIYLSGNKREEIGSLFSNGYWQVEYVDDAKAVKRERNERERAENIAKGLPI